MHLPSWQVNSSGDFELLEGRTQDLSLLFASAALENPVLFGRFSSLCLMSTLSALLYPGTFVLGEQGCGWSFSK